MEAKLGIFTPSAKVYCYKCHGGTFPSKTLTDEEMLEMDNPIALRKGNHYTRCDTCGFFIQLDASVAVERNMALDLTELGYESQLQQTGGMNSACAIYIGNSYLLEEEHQPYYYMTYNIDGDEKYVIYGYDADGDYIEDSEYECDTYEKMLEYIQTIPNLRKIKDEKEGEIQ